MKIFLPVAGNILNLMRQCGYFFERRQGDEMVFARILGAAGSGYPRFHAYIELDEDSKQALINLHLDQKKPSYRGTAAHSAEYDGKTVEKEAERIKQILGL
jgi:hypothetical protein